MNIGICPQCGANIDIAASESVKCDYCGVVTDRKDAAESREKRESVAFSGTLLIAETAMEGGNNDEAINYYNKIIEQDPKFADAWLHKGTCMLHTSTISDLKVSESIACWKAGIRFAENQDAMKRRVSVNIVTAVETFYSTLEKHYLEFSNLKGSTVEHINRFLILESALSYACEISPGKLTSRAGFDLCRNITKTIKDAADKSGDASISALLNKDKDGFFASLADSAGKRELASELEAKLNNRTSYYSKVLSEHDPDFANEEKKRLVKTKEDKLTEAKGCGGCLFIVGLVVIVWLIDEFM